MIREDRFVLSHRPYAVDLSSLRMTSDAQVRINAVWFRRRNRVTIACVGYLWDFQKPAPADTAEFLHRHSDGRYGGSCAGRWDGERYWGAQEPDIIERHLRLLRPALAAYPAVPVGYDGWWRFAKCLELKP